MAFTSSLDTPPTTGPVVGTKPLRPVTRRALVDDVLVSLRKAIIGGVLESGGAIPEARTAAELGVSRVPVREALRSLEREGLVEFDGRGTAKVREFTAESFHEVFSLRLALEPMAARFACQRIQPSDVAALEKNIQRMRDAKALLSDTLLDVEFHDLVVQAARHSLLSACWTNMHSQLQVWMARLHRIQGTLKDIQESSAEGHLAILKDLRSGDEDAAAERMEKHLVSWRERLPSSMWEGNLS